jgi:hypothetical protein
MSAIGYAGMKMQRTNRQAADRVLSTCSLGRPVKKLHLQGFKPRGIRSVLGSYVRIPEGPGLYRESDVPLISDSRYTQ